MTSRKKQSGGALIIILIIIAVLAVLGLLGYVFWSSFMKPAETSEAKTETSIVAEPCGEGEDEAATSGVFCSEEIGIKFTVPEIFTGRFALADNYGIFQGEVDRDTETSAGTSERVLFAELSGTDNFTFTIAREPLRSGYVGVAHGLSGAYFNQDTGVLSGIDFSTSSETLGDAVPSFTVGDTQIFKGTLGDASTSIITYFAVINSKIVKIELNYQGFLGPIEDDPSTIDAQAVFEALDDAIHEIQILE